MNSHLNIHLLNLIKTLFRKLIIRHSQFNSKRCIKPRLYNLNKPLLVMIIKILRVNQFDILVPCYCLDYIIKFLHNLKLQKLSIILLRIYLIMCRYKLYHFHQHKYQLLTQYIHHPQSICCLNKYLIIIKIITKQQKKLMFLLLCQVSVLIDKRVEFLLYDALFGLGLLIRGDIADVLVL